MKHTTGNTGNREMNCCGRKVCNENFTGSGAGRGRIFHQLAEQDVEHTGRPAFFRPLIPAQQPMRGEAG